MFKIYFRLFSNAKNNLVKSNSKIFFFSDVVMKKDKTIKECLVKGIRMGKFICKQHL